MDLFANADLVIVGAGIYGATIAERAANDGGCKVVIVERRNHIGGNAYSYDHPETGIEVHRYGPHVFHTGSQAVWTYVNRFTSFTDYTHRPFSLYRGEVYPLPINLATICQFYRRHFSPDEARALISEQAGGIAGHEPANLEEKAISMIGRPLYEAFIRGYTRKQWQTDPRELPAATITRLPVRYTFDNRYFRDKYQGMPVDGYTSLFRRMLDHENIHVLVDTDWFDIRPSVNRDIQVIYTGPIDRYFDYHFGTLNWRTIDFEESVVPTGDFQGTSTMNYADEDVLHTRIVEYRHFYEERCYPNDRSVIVHEYPRCVRKGDEPLYPVNTREDRRLYRRYKTMAEAENGVHFGGRLATYRYLDMHQAIAAALKDWASLRQTICA